MSWISVKDKLPETVNSVLACYLFNDTLITKGNTVWYSKSNETWVDSGSNNAIPSTVTICYWQPLPEPPKQ